MVLKSVRTLAFSLRDGSGPDDLKVASSSSVTASHLCEHLSDSTVEGGIAVLLVHVMDTGAGVVTEPDGVVFNLVGLPLVDLLDSEEFSAGRLSLAESPQVVPETGLGDDVILSEELHSEHLRGGILGRGGSTSNDLKQTDVLL